MQSCKVLAENIALLHLLGDKPEAPSTNEVPSTLGEPNQDARRRIPFKHEKRAAEAFAVLLANTDDATRVSAVCIQEVEGKDHILIATAANDGNQDGKRDSFDKIAKVLASAVDQRRCDGTRRRQLYLHLQGTDASKEDRDLFEIVTACQARMLARLRSRHAQSRKNKNRAPITQQLQDAIHLRAQIRKTTTLTSLRTKFAEPLTKHFDELERLSSESAYSAPGTNLIIRMLHLIEAMIESVDLKAALFEVPRNLSHKPGYGSPSLPEKFQKLTQYKEAVRYLLSVARKYPIFRAIRLLEIAEHVEESRGFPELPTRTCLLTRSLEAATSQGSAQLKRNLKAKYGKDTTRLHNELEQCAKQTKRVHAEIQLLLYYEKQGDDVIKPRVLSSSKQACFLCNLFIKVYGTYYTPGSHGRLYPRWRVPRLEDLQLPKRSHKRMLKSLNAFNNAIEEKIEAFWRHNVSRLVDPNESVIFVCGSLTPSVMSMTRSTRSNVRSETGDDGGITREGRSDSEASKQKSASSTTSAKDGPKSDDLEPSMQSASCSGALQLSDVKIGKQAEVLLSDQDFATSTPCSLISDASFDVEEKVSGPAPLDTDSPGRCFHRTCFDLQPSHPVACMLSPGADVEFYAATMHVEFAYEHVPLSISKSAASSSAIEPRQATDVVLLAVWLTPESTGSDVNVIDLEESGSETITLDGVLFEKQGLTLQYKNIAISLRADVQKDAT